MEVYTIQEDELNQVPNRPVEYEQDLQSHLLKAKGAKIGGIKLLYIDQEGTSDEEGGFFDILGIGEDGDTVIVELKRGKTPRQVVSQALEYTSGIRKEEYERLNDRFEDFRRSRGEATDESLRMAHADFFKLDDPIAPDDFNGKSHIVVVAAEFDDVTLNMADLLREHELDVVCVRYQTFADAEGSLNLLTTESVRRPLALEPGSPEKTGKTETEKLQEEFWNKFIEKTNRQSDSNLYTASAKARSYLPVRGTLPDDADIALGTDTHRGQIQVKLHLRDAGSEMYEFLNQHKSDIESEIGDELIWDAKSASYEQIRLVRDGNIKEETEDWDDFQNWLMEYWKRFDEVFGTYLNQMPQ